MAMLLLGVQGHSSFLQDCLCASDCKNGGAVHRGEHALFLKTDDAKQLQSLVFQPAVCTMLC